jgi:uncharacterized protein (TIGR02145 family)
MKKLFNLALVLVIFSNCLFAQEIILTFVPANDTITIDSIQATNLTTNERLTVPGNESINLNDITTGTIELEFSDNSLIYPNPFHDYTTLQLETTRKDAVRLLMINSAGESVAAFNQNLLPGNHQFKISAKSPGMYFLTNQSGNKNISHKLINMTGGNDDRIEYEGTNAESAVTNKSSKLTQSEQVIHFKLYSGDNVTIIADSPTESKTYEVEFYECKDADGRHYPIVQIGKQWWMAKNLAYLPSVSPASLGSNIDRLYYVSGYNGTDINAAKASDNYSTYGVLYNWPAAMDGLGSSSTNPSGIRGICPEGWHLPSDAEWQQLELILGMTEVQVDAMGWRGTHQGTQLKATNGWNGDGNGTNTIGFSALPSGARDHGHNGSFIGIGDFCSWWTSSEVSSFNAWDRGLYYLFTNIGRSGYKPNGLSVRCVRD